MPADQANALGNFTIFNHLREHGVPLRSSASLESGIGIALWQRNETVFTRYEVPGHHTLSLYVDGGAGIRRRMAGQQLAGGGAGTLCLMPAGVSTDWDVAGEVSLLHLYVPLRTFERAALETFDQDPDRLTLRDLTFFRDSYLDNALRSTLLPLDWQAPADRLTLSYAGQMLLTYLLARYADGRPGRVGVARGGLAPAGLRRVCDYISAHLDQPLSLDMLAEQAALSPYHFARQFKHSTGESPHGFVMRQRIELAKRLLGERRHELAEVALMCGFSGQSHFTERFRRQTGMTPRQYVCALRGDTGHA
ncbi:MAG: helix-turn-helix transcriptional regulator [Burkholderiales bacterium]|nr:helix-turn-helix transcriptional regulator [Burkholderiales bacterium]